ncbi:MAG: MFS transporter [Chitinophagaceae bacterium]|jgi:MFS family permease|nr:MFS transporter [Chitinophagaceae bacterium]OQY93421.1 MAG: MFS transporter [Sphingobacteriales bacterium UTBCD1]
MRIINRTVLILSLVSLFADIASEMLYPVIPLYLEEIGFTVLWIGLLEGLANFTAGISKGYFGELSDRKGIRLPLVRTGYFLSAVSKPMMALFVYPLWIFFSRSLDRLGKGIRTAPRDALLSAQATKETKGRIFGFHRGMDTLGAAIGPAFTLIFLYFYPLHYKAVFYFAFLPGLISVLLLFVLKEKKSISRQRPGNFFSFFRYWKTASTRYKKLVTGLLLFALFNSSDFFLLLKTKEVTGSDNITIAAYVFYNLVFALTSYPLGVLADKLSFKKVLSSGFLLFAIVYGCFAVQPSVPVIFILFFIYGIYAAATEGVSKAWITNTADENNIATAIGFYTSGESVCSFLASVIAGGLWLWFGSFYTFGITAIISFCVLIYFLWAVK